MAVGRHRITSVQRIGVSRALPIIGGVALIVSSQ